MEGNVGARRQRSSGGSVGAGRQRSTGGGIGAGRQEVVDSRGSGRSVGEVLERRGDAEGFVYKPLAVSRNS